MQSRFDAWPIRRFGRCGLSVFWGVLAPKKALLVLALLSIAMALPAKATLWDRGGGLIYDDFSDITWLQDASYPYTSGYWPEGERMTWYDAMAWADQLEYAGYDDWRLPTSEGPHGFCNGTMCTETEMGHLYYFELGNYGSAVFHSGPFINLRYGSYWLSTESWGSHKQNYALVFAVNEFLKGGGLTADSFKGNLIGCAWAVRDGDVTPVPVPSTISNLLIGLMALSGIRIKHHITRRSHGLGRQPT